MNYKLHPDAASEHEEQIAYYEARCQGLGRRYHRAFRTTIAHICDSPKRYKPVASGIRHASIRGFPYHLIFREKDNGIQVLAIAHYRRRAGYWMARLDQR